MGQPVLHDRGASPVALALGGVDQAEVWVEPHEEHGHRDEYVGAASQHRPDRFDRARLGDKDRGHDNVADEAEPAPQGHRADIGPGDRESEIEHENQEPWVRLDEPPDRPPPAPDHRESPSDHHAENQAVDGAAVQARVNGSPVADILAGAARAEPLRDAPRRADKDPEERQPGGGSDPRAAIPSLQEEAGRNSRQKEDQRDV